MNSKEAGGISTPEHFHRWSIDTPNGPTSRGVCKHCGAQKEFRNSAKERSFDSARLNGSPAFSPDSMEKKSQERLQKRRNQKKSAEERLAQLTDAEQAVLEGIANGVEPYQIQKGLAINRVEYGKIRAKCATIGGNLFETVRLAIRTGTVNIIEDVSLDPLPGDVEETLSHVLNSGTLEQVSIQLGCSEAQVRERTEAALDEIGALTVYHATAIMEVRAMKSEQISE